MSVNLFTLFYFEKFKFLIEILNLATWLKNKKTPIFFGARKKFVLFNMKIYQKKIDACITSVNIFF